MSAHSCNLVNRFLMSVNTGVGNSLEAVQIHENVSVATTVLLCEVDDLTVVDYRSKCADSIYVRRINSMFSDSRNTIMYDRHTAKRDTNIGE